MNIKATLKVQLLANDVLVAETDDEQLWRQVLAAIQGRASAAEQEDQTVLDPDVALAPEARLGDGKGVGGLAKALGVTKELVQGALDPTNEAPYLQLDEGNWEAFKKNTPARGPNSVAAIQVTGTLLCLWFKHAGLEGLPTQSQALTVLHDIGAEDKNASRSITNCDWLQGRSGGTIQINPAKLSRAIAVAKAFVTQQPIDNG